MDGIIENKNYFFMEKKKYFEYIDLRMMELFYF